MTATEDSLAVDHVSTITAALGHSEDSQLHETAVGLAKRTELEHPINRAPTSIAAAAVYLATLQTDPTETQADIATVADVSTKTIRSVYREIAATENLTVSHSDSTQPTSSEQPTSSGQESGLIRGVIEP